MRISSASECLALPATSIITERHHAPNTCKHRGHCSCSGFRRLRTTTPAPIPTELQYQAPTNASESGTIVGSQENSSWADDFTVFVFSVDRKRVVAGRRGWDTPLLLSPGEHRITVAFNRGAFVSAASLMLPVVAGDTFEVRYSTDVAFNGTSSYCDFWIVDKKTGRASTDIVRAPAWRSDRRGYAYVPIYIPKK